MSDNQKKQNPKMRMILVVVAIVAFIAGGVLMWRNHSQKTIIQSSTKVSGTPEVQSLPGAGNPSNQYVADQNLQNNMNAIDARKKGTSDVPTITRPSFVGDPNSTFGGLSMNDNDAAKNACSLSKVARAFKPNPENCQLDKLQLARKAGVTAEELSCQGCACPSLKLAGYTVSDLKAVGYSAQQLKDCGFTLGQLVEAGFSASELKAAGYTAKQLADVGFTAGQLATAGFSAPELKNAGFTAAQLAAAGFTADELKKAGFTPTEIAAAINASKNCSLDRLKAARVSDVSATDLRGQGCSLAALKAAGYTAAELKAAGFSAQQLKDAGFTAKQLKEAGFSAADLKAAGFNAGELKAAGFGAKELKAAGFTAEQLRAAGYTASDLKAVGFTPAELQQAGFSKGDLLRAGYTPEEAGYSGDGAAAGNTNNALAAKLAGKDPVALRAAGYTAEDLKAAGFTAQQLKNAGFSRGELLQAGFTPDQIGSMSASDPLSAGAMMPSIKDNSAQAALARFEKEQQAQMTKQQIQDQIQRQTAAMTMQAQKMLEGWGGKTTQTMDQATPETKSQLAAGLGGNGDQSTADDKFTIKAGTVMYAVLQTSVNTDEETPILAKIVAGPLKGSTLVGGFKRVNKKVLLSFNLINMPSASQSLPINAVAIDPNTARTSVGGDVNNHYLLRYGTLFASAFVSGLSDALISARTTTMYTLLGPIQMSQPINTQQAALVATGNVGKQYANVMGKNFNTPPTVKIPSGIGMGLLFMQDVQIPKIGMNNSDNKNQDSGAK